MSKLCNKVFLSASVLAIFLSACTTTSHAKTLFLDDFQDGKADGWKASGKGDFRLTTYANNVSLRLTRKASAILPLRTIGYKDIVVSTSFAALDLEKNDACVLEVSKTLQGEWREIGRIGPDQADGKSLHIVSGATPELDNQKQIFIRISAKGNSKDDTCWADNLTVEGRAINEMPLAPHLSSNFLLTAKRFAKPVKTSAYAKPLNAGVAQHEFEGRLSSPTKKMDGFDVDKDYYQLVANTKNINYFPAFDVALVQDGDVLIPVHRGPIPGVHPKWEFVFSPGAVWSQAGDLDWSRAALPFALQEKNSNCIHNGLMTFMYKGNGKISKMAWQIGSQTCSYFKVDMWGISDVKYAPVSLANAVTIKMNWQQEQRNKLPIKPIGELEKNYLGADASNFGSVKEIQPKNMTVYGHYDKETLYRGGCDTHYGPYPYCDNMVVPSYSLAKTIVGTIGLLRLEKLYSGASQALISDLVPACRDSKWDGVTMLDALDMSTGNYATKAYGIDEMSDAMSPLFTEETHKKRIDVMCEAFPHKSAPGEEWAYHTSDTYILGTAMQAYWRKQTGRKNADFYTDLLVPMWTDLGLSPEAKTTRRTYDKARQPFTGFGLTLQQDDMIKLGQFLQMGGKVKGEPMLDEVLLSESMQNNPEKRGHKAVIDRQRYQHGLWAWNAGPDLGCKGELWIPSMVGFGGVVVAMFPNGHTYQHTSDGGIFKWKNAAIGANEIKPMCPNAN